MTVVSAALIEDDGTFLICRRRLDQVHAGKWEFPGGKVEPGESAFIALQRELKEELGIVDVEGREFERYEYRYGDRPPILLAFFLVTSYRGEIDDSQFAETRWVRLAAMAEFDFLAGDDRVVEGLARGRYPEVGT